MSRFSRNLPRILVTVVFAGAVVFIASSFRAIARASRDFQDCRPPIGADPLPHTLLPSATSDAQAAPDRPANVGNALAEDFLRKVEPAPVIPAEGTIHLKDETFSAAYDELYDKRDAYYGRTLDLAGIVMAQDDLGPGGFLVGRKLLWCCELDTYFIGFLAYTQGEAPRRANAYACGACWSPGSTECRDRKGLQGSRPAGGADRSGRRGFGVRVSPALTRPAADRLDGHRQGEGHHHQGPQDLHRGLRPVSAPPIPVGGFQHDPRAAEAA